ncbi:MAG: hypothetical protein KatS3mg023_3280 [Armatimonadota bacterium]|nr:MAG: hypothetical protein KatS3mg023_3280 [Armatimonadota bacterium]
MAQRVLIGTSGWSYDHWRSIFYPPELEREGWLAFYARVFPTVEINSSFYRLPFENIVLSWHQRTPESFVFAAKFSRQATHVQRLRDCQPIVQRWMERLSLLKDKLGVVLIQLPPGLHKDVPLLEAFLQLFPKGTRLAVEFRHSSWECDEVYDMLRTLGVAHCTISYPRYPMNWTVTAPFAYVRLHGVTQAYDYCYSMEELRELARQIRNLPRDVQQVFVYLNNDTSGYAPDNARQLQTIFALESEVAGT